MKIAYLFLVHKHPEFIKLIIEHLMDGSSDFYIHVDKKSEFELFEKALRPLEREHIFFVKPRLNIHWGAFSIIKATLNCCRMAIGQKKNYDYFINMSGQDYPIKSIAEIHSFLSKNKGTNFIEHIRKPGRGGFGSEYTKFHFMDIDNIWLRKFVHGFSHLIGVFYKRKFLPHMSPYLGSGWWILSSKMIHYIIERINENLQIIKFFKKVLLPDEVFFQTLVLNSPMKDTVNDKNMRYIRWSRGGPTPDVFRLSDFEELADREELFARKFDPELDFEIIKKINKILLNKRG